VRAELGPVLLQGLYLFAGLGVLAALGIARTARSALIAAGMAYMTGLCAVLLTGTWLLAAGVAVTLAVTTALALAIGFGGLALAVMRRRRDGALETTPPVRGRAPKGERVLTVLTAAALVAFLLLVLRSSTRLDIAEWDSWSIWTRKALILLEFGSPEPAFFTSRYYAIMHPDYPLLLPLMEANWFRAAGFADIQGVHAQLWLVLAGFCGAAAWIVGRAGRAVAWLPVLLLVVTASGVRGHLLSGYADLPMALLVGLGVLLLGAWLQSGDRRELGLGVLMLASAAATKNEGLAAGTAVLAVTVAVRFLAPDAGTGRLRSAAAATAAFAAFAVSLLPWRAWMAAHSISGDMKVSQGLDPGYLLSRTERVWPAVKGLTGPLAAQNEWQYLVPLGAAAALVFLTVRGLRRLAAFYLGCGALVFASLVWAYWFSGADLAWQLNTSATRTISAVVAVGAAAALHLGSGSAVPPDGGRPHEPGGGVAEPVPAAEPLEERLGARRHEAPSS
jgi:hypothetical protein